MMVGNYFKKKVMKKEEFEKIRVTALQLSSAYNVDMCYTLWNTFSEDFPEEAMAIQGTESDCFGNSKNIQSFLKHLKGLCVEH